MIRHVAYALSSPPEANDTRREMDAYRRNLQRQRDKFYRERKFNLVVIYDRKLSVHARREAQLEEAIADRNDMVIKKLHAECIQGLTEEIQGLKEDYDEYNHNTLERYEFIKEMHRDADKTYEEAQNEQEAQDEEMQLSMQVLQLPLAPKHLPTQAKERFISLGGQEAPDDD